MRRPRPLQLTALTLGLVTTAAACSGINPTVAVSGDPRAETSATTIITFLERDEDGRFGTLLDCVTVAGASEAITGTGPVTLFAPTDDAFREAGITCDPEEEADPEDAAELRRTLQQHVLNYDVRFSEPEGFDPEDPPRLLEIVDRRTTLDSVLLDAAGTALVIDPAGTVHTEANPSVEARVVEEDLQAPNGIVQVIDTVLVPPAKPAFPPTTAAPQPYE